MPQQINLCASVHRVERQPFAAPMMLTVLGASMVVIGALAFSWVWSLQGSTVAYRQMLDTQSGEIKILQAAIERSRANSGPVDAALLKKVQESKAAVVQREKVLERLRLGMFRPGEGHSDRLLMVAQTVPEKVWVNALKVDAGVFEVSGYTLETAALNTWVSQLGAHPLMRDLKLSAVRVDGSTLEQALQNAAGPASAGTPPAAASSEPKVWAFSLLSQEPAAPATGAKP